MTNDNDLIRRAALQDAGYDTVAVAASQTADPVTNAAGRQPEQMYLICKYGGYYRPNCRGYTSSIDKAGRYTLAEAERETHPNGPDGPRDGMTYIPSPPVNADSRQRVVVKPLVWEGHSDDQRSGDYVIKPSYGQGPKRLLLARGSKLVSWHDDMDEAQRAGQDDHEARILAALEPQPDPRDTALEIWKLANSRDADDPVFIAAIAAMIGEKK